MITKIKNYERGFTLIEILASILVLVAVGSVTSGIISSSLRGANKTNTTENLRQNGNYALNQISKDIQYAQPFDGKETGFSKNGTDFYTNCIDAFASPTPTPDTLYKRVTVISPADIKIAYVCDGGILTAEINDSGTATTLIDSTLDLTDCSITCKQSKITDIPIVKINFKVGSSGLFFEKSGQINFETTVTMRNYKR